MGAMVENALLGYDLRTDVESDRPRTGRRVIGSVRTRYDELVESMTDQERSELRDRLSQEGLVLSEHIDRLLTALRIFDIRCRISHGLTKGKLRGES